MKDHEFYSRYANLPKEKRGIPLDFAKHGMLSMDGLYKLLSSLQDLKRPLDIEEERLLEVGAKYLPYLEGKHPTPDEASL